jgi:hypothetical protein
MSWVSPATIIGLVAAAAAALSIVVLVVSVRRGRRARAEVEQRLTDAREEVARLAQQVGTLAEEVRAGRRSAVDDREYVITTLAEAAQVTGAAEPRPLETPTWSSVADELEEQAVTRLAQVDTSSRLGARVAGAGVKAIALGHGFRRALAQDNRDRASAEALVARRRSRRTRRQELREARRLIRAVRAQQHERGAAGVADTREDVA